jgi:hypothetical protein
LRLPKPESAATIAPAAESIQRENSPVMSERPLIVPPSACRGVSSMSSRHVRMRYGSVPLSRMKITGLRRHALPAVERDAGRHPQRLAALRVREGLGGTEHRQQPLGILRPCLALYKDCVQTLRFHSRAARPRPAGRRCRY